MLSEIIIRMMNQIQKATIILIQKANQNNDLPYSFIVIIYHRLYVFNTIFR